MATIAVSTDLLSEVKNWLDITWEDPDADAKLSGQIRRGIAYISQKTGIPISAFGGVDGDQRGMELLLNYVLYDRAGAVSDFKKNYASDIVGLRIRWEVEHATPAEG